MFVLILTKGSENITNDHPEVQSWKQQGTSTLPNIKRQAQNEIDRWKLQGKMFQIKIREYTDIPIIHGFSVKEPFKVWYIST
jgi:hypothetical protein